MASSYTSNSGIEKPAEGDQTGEWGDTVNTNMDIIDRSINGVGAITLSGTTHTLTTTDGTLSDGMYKVLVLGGSPSGTNTITISPNDQDKVYIVVNGSGQTATFTQGSGGNVSVLNGDSKIIYADGAGSGAAVVDITANLSFSSVNIDGGTIDGTAIGGASAAAGTFTTVTASGEIDGASLDISGNADIDGTLETDALSIASTTVTSTAAELNYNDTGAAVGTVVASKTVTVDANKDVASFRNITLTGELDAGSLDISGNADIDGTLEADAMTLNGTAITTTATLSTGISNTNVPVFTTGVADDDFLRVAGTSIEGRSAAEVLSDIGASAAAGSGSIVTTGALDSGSITSGFGTINNGSSAITTTGLISGGSLDIDDVVINGSTIGHTDDTDLITVANGVATVAGEVSMTTLDIGGTNVTSTAAELNLVDGSSAGSVVNSKAVIYSSGGVVNATDVAVSGSGNRSVQITSTDGIGFMEIGSAADNISLIDLKTPSSDDYDVRLQSQAAGAGGSLLIAGGTFLIGGSGESMATFADDGAVTLYYDNVAKLATTAPGADITGSVTIPDADSGEPRILIVDTNADASAEHLDFQKASASPADNDQVGIIRFISDNDAGQTTIVAQVIANITDVTDGTENGRLGFETMVDGTIAERMTITGEGKVGIGTASPAQRLELYNAGFTAAQITSNSSSETQLRFATNTAARISNQANTALIFDTNATERARISNDGKVGIGATGNLTGYVNLPESDYGEGFNWFSSGTAANRGGVGHYSYESRIYYGSSDNLTFVDGGPSGTERVRIDASGNLLVGTTNTSLGIGNTNTGFQVENNGTFLASRADNVAGSLNRNNDGSILTVRRSGNEVGTIGVTSSATSYNTTSDYRLKENVSYTFDATTRLKQLKPARFNFKVDTDKTVDGFLAHEVSSIVPEAITGTKDEVNSDGDPIYQGIDQSKLVPLLVKTIQELEARITALEAG